MTALSPLPVTVVSGYLGSGKTSLINHLLRHADGRRIIVMVNDFGALNIDADLLESAEEDTLTLSNGCICCTMGTELLYALSDALDRRPRPDCLVIEASGVAEPQKIAAAAHAEPEMRYCGIVTMADAANISDRLADPLVGAQVAAQIRAADLVLVTKTDLAALTTVESVLREHTEAPIVEAPRGHVPVGLILDRPEGAPPATATAHAHGDLYTSWSTDEGVVDRAALKALLADPPNGLYRFKGHIELTDGETVEAHLVGRTWEIRRTVPLATRAVAIGLRPLFDPNAFAARWAQMSASSA